MNIDEVSIMFESGEKEKAVEILEKYVSSKSKFTPKTVNAYANLFEFKYKMGLDCSKEVSVLEKVRNDDLWGFTFLLLGLYFLKNDDRQKAESYFRSYIERVNDPEEFAEILGCSDEWLRVKEQYSFFKSTEDSDLHSKCNFGENIEVLSEKEKEFVLCEGFVEEVNSGGFEAYFSTDYSRHCVITAEYLEKNKSKIYPKMLRKAIALFPENFDFSDPAVTEDYLDEHEKILDKFEKLENKIYESTEDIDLILENLKEQIQ